MKGSRGRVGKGPACMPSVLHLTRWAREDHVTLLSRQVTRVMCPDNDVGQRGGQAGGGDHADPLSAGSRIQCHFREGHLLPDRILRSEAQ